MHFAPISTDASAPGDEIQEIIVTAQRRTENIQNVPIAIQALTGETLSELNVTNFDDFVKYLPNVTDVVNGPGQTKIFMRGLERRDQGTQSGGPSMAFRTWPFISMNNRVSSRSKPRCVCGGLGARRGLGGTSGHLVRRGRPGRRHPLHHEQAENRCDRGEVTAGYGPTAGGDPNSDVTAVLNVPPDREHARGPGGDLR